MFYKVYKTSFWSLTGNALFSLGFILPIILGSRSYYTYVNTKSYTLVSSLLGIGIDLLTAFAYWWLFSIITRYPIRLTERMTVSQDRLQIRNIRAFIEIPFSSIKNVYLAVFRNEDKGGYIVSGFPLIILYKDNKELIQKGTFLNDYAINNQDKLELLNYISTYVPVSSFAKQYVEDKKSLNLEAAYIEAEAIKKQGRIEPGTKEVLVGFLFLPVFLILGFGVGVSSFVRHFFPMFDGPWVIFLSTLIPFVFWKVLYRYAKKKQ